MYGSPSSKDLNLPIPAPTKSPFGRRGEEGADGLPQRDQMGGADGSAGILRYRSAPSTMFAEVGDDFLPAARGPSSDGGTMYTRFLGPDLREKPHFPPAAVEQHRHHLMLGHGPVESLYRTASSSAVLDNEQIKSSAPSATAAGAASAATGTSVNGFSNLLRQSSSPAGLFNDHNLENGFGPIRGVGGYRDGHGGGSIGGDNRSRLKGQLSFSSRHGSMMSLISEVESEHLEDSSLERTAAGGNNSNGGGCGSRFIPGYQVASWETSALLSDSFSGMKRPPGHEPDDDKMMAGISLSGTQLTTTKSSSEIEKFLQFQDAVQCKIRAKRGCATHPRSIAERVRRTRISERIRKLQELVPNMDKQTNTADMLDLAVDYIKDLQKQVKVLNESRASCTCSSGKQNQ